MGKNNNIMIFAEEEYMTKDAQIEKEETLKKVLSGELDDSHGSQSCTGLVLSQLTCKVESCTSLVLSQLTGKVELCTSLVLSQLTFKVESCISLV